MRQFRFSSIRAAKFSWFSVLAGTTTLIAAGCSERGQSASDGTGSTENTESGSGDGGGSNDPHGVGENIELTGSVTDTSGNALSGVSLKLLNAEIQTTSSNDGTFTLRGSSTEGALDEILEASLPGYFVETTVVSEYRGATPTIVLRTLKDELTAEKAFTFTDPPIVRSGNPDDRRYVGSNFAVTESLNVNGQNLILSWKTESDETDHPASLTINSGAAEVVRGPVSRSTKGYEAIASATINEGTATAAFPFQILSEPLKIMTWNIWGKEGHKAADQPIEPLPSSEYDYQYGYVYNGRITTQRDRVAELMRAHDPDVLGLIETYGQIDFLKAELGYDYSFRGVELGDNISILSRVPITKEMSLGDDFYYLGGEVELSETRKLVLFSSWFTSTTSGWPTEPDETSDDEGIEFDKIHRLHWAQKLVDFISSEGYFDETETRPLFVVGDHNSISHMDFTEAAAGSEQNYGRGAIQAPVSTLFTDHLFIDSFRAVHPDPLIEPGSSYGPIYGGHYRIDYIYHQSDALIPTASVVVDEFLDGKVKVAPTYDGGGNLVERGVYVFPSDHSAFVTTYEWID